MENEVNASYTMHECDDKNLAKLYNTSLYCKGENKQTAQMHFPLKVVFNNSTGGT